MNGFLLLVPFLLIRFFLLSKLDKNGIKRAAHFPSMIANEKTAYWIYQVSNVMIFIYLCFIDVSIKEVQIFELGISLYIFGLILCTISIIDFASPKQNGLNTTGIYKYSRNPMYVSYFFIFVGCSILTNSAILFWITIVFQISAHWIILAEERWCIKEFGQLYSAYMLKVRRYI